MASPRWMVIGSNSFSGSHFVAYLLEHGYAVTCISRSEEIAPCYRAYDWVDSTSETGKATFHQLSLNDDSAQIAQLVDDFKITHVVNFAALGMVAESWLYPVDYYTTNVIGNVQLHDALRQIDSLERYVHISTPEVYGNTEGMVYENAPFNPSTPYAVSRAACDLHLKSFFDNYNFPVIWTRAANVYGPGQQPYRIIPRMILCAKLGMKLQLHGGGKSIRSFIHIRDVADATHKIALQGTTGSTYHLSTQNFISIHDLVAQICKTMGVAFSDIVENAPERAGKDHAYYLESSRIRKELNWSDSIDLSTGIQETISWVEQWESAITEQPLQYQHQS